MLTMFSQEGHFCHATIQAFQNKKTKKKNPTSQHFGDNQRYRNGILFPGATVTLGLDVIHLQQKGHLFWSQSNSDTI